MSSSLPTTTTSSVDALRARGVAAHVAERLVRCATPDLIGAWNAYAERHGLGAGFVVNGIKSGHPPPDPRPRQPRDSFAAELRDWLRTQLPECCDEHGDPHPAAVQALIKLRWRYGKGKVTVRVHGAVIRAAVKAAEMEEASGEGRGERGEDA